MEAEHISSAVGKIVLPEGYELMNYVIECKLGQGGFGITYLAKEAITGYRVVIKEAFPQGYVYREPGSYKVMPHPDCEEETRWALENFQKEACTLRTFAKHDNIVQVNSVFYALNTGYIVMDFIEGKPLSELYPAGKPIEKAELVRIMLKLLRALEQLHARGIVHRDIKPANVMMSAAGEPVLIDFGAARPVRNTVSATQIGTPGYAPPEQMSQTKYDKHPKPHIDFYALGATCYRLITGSEPDYVPYKLADDAKLCRIYGKDLLRSIDRARELLPAERWQSADEWIAVLTAEQRAKEEAELKARTETEARQKKMSTDLAAEKKARRQAEAREQKLKEEIAAERTARQEVERDLEAQRRVLQEAQTSTRQLGEELEKARKGKEKVVAGKDWGWSLRGMVIWRVFLGMMYGAAYVYGIYNLIAGNQQTLSTTWWLCEIAGLVLGAIWAIATIQHDVETLCEALAGWAILAFLLGGVSGAIVGAFDNGIDGALEMGGSWGLYGAALMVLVVSVILVGEEYY